MNAQHTPGRLEASGNGLHIGIKCVATTHNSDPLRRVADARRIAACWNACEGISTDELEHIASTGGMLGPREDVARIAGQRDELLHALIGMLNIVGDSRGVAGYHLNGDTAEWDEFDEVDAAIAATAKVKGQEGATK